MSKRFLILPFLYLIFAAISLTIIQSIAPNLTLMQGLFFLFGGVVFLGTSQVPLSIWHRLAPILYAGTIFLLGIPLVLGIVTRGTAAWIPIGPFHLQPSQFAQPIGILLASFFLSKNSQIPWQNSLKYLLLAIIPLSLIFIEPDFGSFIVLTGALGSLLFFSNIPITRLLLFLGSTMVLALFAWVFLFQPYQKQRITNFLSPSQEQETNYHAQQSEIAVGAGQIWGRGLGHGVQSQLRFLPERQTDFIFASLAEETGFVGSALVLTAYAGLLLYLFYLAQQYPLYSIPYFLLLGSIFLFFIQIFINIGMNIRLMPITGITLPFISYGGSSLLSFAFLFGLIQHLIVKQPVKKLREIK